MNNNEITSPCITVCKTDPISGYCYGCGRSLEDKKLWSNPDIDNEKKIENLKVIRNRLNGWQKTAFDLSYDHKKKNGVSLIKHNLQKSQKS